MQLKHFLSSVALILLVTACAEAPQNPKPQQVNGNALPAYDYPIANPYAATVIGVPPQMRVDYSALPTPADKSIVLFKERSIPEGFWYAHGLKYSTLLQSKPAPVVYLIAGTGADSHSETAVALGDMFYSAGLSVVLLPSPTYSGFIINASWNFTPGNPTEDAKDIYQVIEHVEPEIEKQAHVTGHMIVGYSLGALDALYTAKLDETQKKFHFSKVLLINPPLNLYHSMQTIDSLLYMSLPHGISDADYFIKNTVNRLSNVKQSSDALDFSNERLLIEAYSQYQLGDRRLATMIGLSFRLAAANMIFTADVMGHDGYIFPKNQEFTTSTPLNHYMAVALRTSFQNYFDQIYTHKYLAAYPSHTAQDLIQEGNLESLSGYLASHPNIGLLTNKDDIILEPGESDRLIKLFGDRAIVFPTGGHLGNLMHSAVAWRIIHFMGQP